MIEDDFDNEVEDDDLDEAFDEDVEKKEFHFPGPPALEAEGVSKRFCRDLKRSLMYGVQDICREFVGKPPRTGELKRNEFWALQDVSLMVPRGAAMAIVGRNGSGKTTLMRIIAGLIKPTTGAITTRGRLAPLLALGAGFNSVLTGRENIYTNMTILGLTREEIDARFEDVVKFSEIDYALDAPVQSYSSGMVARLGFACAIQTQPDVLLLDEVMAVGDRRFRKKCIEKIQEIRATGMSMIIVHHFPDLLLAVCNKAVYLSEGRMVASGEAESVIAQYEEEIGRTDAGPAATVVVGETSETREESPLVEFRELAVTGHDPEAPDRVVTGEAADICVRLNLLERLRGMNVTARVFKLPALETLDRSEEESEVLKFSARRDRKRFAKLKPGPYSVRIHLPTVGLVPGRYEVAVSVFASRNAPLSIGRRARFVVHATKKGFGGRFFQPHEWQIACEAETAEAHSGR
jgi:lipopolysaccharide transport system ATP-binding protein